MTVEEIREQLADAAIRWVRAKESEALKDERKLQSTTKDMNNQDQALQDIRSLVQQLPKER